MAQLSRERETERINLPEKTPAREMAQIFGSWVTAAGCFSFLAAVYELAFKGTPFPGTSELAVKYFILAGVFLVPGWLLLRFADALFPFGRRFSK